MRPLTDVHDGGGRHVTEGRGEEEERVEALAPVHLRLRTTSVDTQQNVEDREAAELSQEHPHGLQTEREKGRRMSGDDGRDKPSTESTTRRTSEKSFT